MYEDFIETCYKKITIISATKAALVVGTILALINHYDAIFAGNLTRTNIFQIILSYFVPYCTATYGSASHCRHLELASSASSNRK